MSIKDIPNVEEVLAITDPGEVGREHHGRIDRLMINVGNVVAWAFPILMIAIVAQVFLRAGVSAVITAASCANPSATLTNAESLSICLAARTASGLRPAMAAAITRASSTGVSLNSVTRPYCSACSPLNLRPVKTSSLIRSSRARRRPGRGRPLPPVERPRPDPAGASQSSRRSHGGPAAHCRRGRESAARRRRDAPRAPRSPAPSSLRDPRPPRHEVEGPGRWSRR